MKKLLLVFTVAAFLTACNGNSTKTENTSDSTSVTAPATTDTTAPATTDTTNKMSADTTHKMSADTTKK
ncbi:MAG TPA: hypothetical protein VN722_12160 [Hanamia sp.]|nr:hypothetical protein [Hanamia sp.]